MRLETHRFQLRGDFPKVLFRIEKRAEEAGEEEEGKKEKFSHFNVRLAKFKYLNSPWFINSDIVDD